MQDINVLGEYPAAPNPTATVADHVLLALETLEAFGVGRTTMSLSYVAACFARAHAGIDFKPLRVTIPAAAAASCGRVAITVVDNVVHVDVKSCSGCVAKHPVALMLNLLLSYGHGEHAVRLDRMATSLHVKYRSVKFRPMRKNLKMAFSRAEIKYGDIVREGQLDWVMFFVHPIGDRFNPDAAQFEPGDLPERTHQSTNNRFALALPHHPLPGLLLSAIPLSRDEAARRNAGLRFRALHELFRRYADIPIVSSDLPAEQRQLFLLKQLEGLEFHERCEVRNYDMDSAVLHATQHHQQYRIDCAGLAENRPSVLRGDRVILRANDGKRQERRGIVHHVNLDHLVIAVGNGVASRSTYQVIFTVPRTQYLRRYRAVGASASTFITAARARRPGRPLTNFSIDAVMNLASQTLNVEQSSFIRGVVSGKRRCSLLFGPPGTGKTTTLVSLIALLRRIGSRVLVVTPSNASADLFVERCDDQECFNATMRFMAFSRDPRTIPDRVNQRSQKEPSRQELERARVVVSTLSMAGAVFGMGVTPGHFTHVIVDEAAQATEQDVLLALQLAAPDTSIVLAGDPKQLGPQIRSTICAEHGMGRSALERLVCAEGADHTLLVQNYRAHPAIVDVYNSLTYNMSLIAQGPEWRTHAMIRCGLFTALGFPMGATAPIGMLHVAGLESQRPESPSWINNDEIAVVKYVISVAVSRSVPAKDIVVLTPYRAQCQKIADMLHHELFMAFPSHYPRYDRRDPPIKVCSVETYQGREADLVILSCVRSRLPQEKVNDKKFALGFLQQPQRVNVAVSRAKAGLIIVGNAFLMATDAVTLRPLVKHFADRRALLKSALQNDAFPEPLDMSVVDAHAAMYAAGAGVADDTDAHTDQPAVRRDDE
jgi:helicase MOV-10